MIGQASVLRVDDRGGNDPVARPQMRSKPTRHAKTDYAAAAPFDGLMERGGHLAFSVAADNDHARPGRNAGFECQAYEGDDKAIRRSVLRNPIEPAGNSLRRGRWLKELGKASLRPPAIGRPRCRLVRFPGPLAPPKSTLMDKFHAAIGTSIFFYTKFAPRES